MQTVAPIALALSMGGLVAQEEWFLQPVTGPARGVAAAAFDRHTGFGVLFGGGVAGTFAGSAGPTYGDTWIWDGQWSLVAPTTAPPSRKGHMMAFDEARGRVVLFGGWRSPTGMLNDTWEWDGAAWTPVATTVQPSPRAAAAFAYDPLLQKCLLFGGADAGGGYLNDTWEWDGANWQQAFPANVPSARGYSQMAFDGNRSRLALVGGWGVNQFPGGGQPSYDAARDHWEWDGLDWMLVASQIPSPRSNHLMFFDSSRARLVRFGGLSYFIPKSNETWEFDGVAWVQAPILSPPPARNNPCGFYDSWRGGGVLHGGFLGTGSGWASTNPVDDTWVLTGVGPATATSYGAGCPGPAGTMALQVVQRPVMGTSMLLAVANIDAMSIPLMVVGLTPIVVPIGGIYGAAGSCVLRTTLDIQELIPPTHAWSLAIPNDPSWFGLAILNQAAQLSFDSFGSIYNLSLSNAVRSTVGSY
ncbi:MAG: hypothetical protein KF830_06075 [Planctomycetes bacterium]|nr:hypothetical protein [Planctomycetota bacterium]